MEDNFPTQLGKLPCWTCCLWTEWCGRCDGQQQSLGDRVFYSWKTKEGCSAELVAGTSKSQALSFLGTLVESLGRHTWRAKDPGKLDVLQEGTSKDTGTGCPHVPKDWHGWTESCVWNSGEKKKGKLMTVGGRAGQLSRTTRTSWGFAGREL